MNPKKFLSELKRRNVYRGAVLYGMGAWLITQIATQVFPFFEIPNSAVRFVIVALVIGFPIAMLLAWLYELTPEGIVRAEDVDLAKQKGIGRKMDFVIIGVLLLVIAMLIYERRPFRASSGEAIPPKSIAVLPFENFSDDKANAFFADGIQDDILTSLAKIRDLRVISRTSVESYRGAKGARSLREIARALGAANVLEGSVRREGNRVVVNVQLIDALQDRHLWANRYDRTLADSLGLQGELATEIANALSATLSPDEKSRFETKPTTNADAYVLYLRALQYENAPDTLLEDFKLAEQLFTQAITLDPAFALAHARLASTRAKIFQFHEPLEQWKQGARAEVETALRLQPNLSEAHHARGLCYYWMDGDYEGALEQFAIASRLSPNNIEPPFLTAAIRRRQGRWDEALQIYQKIQTLDPRDARIVKNLMFTNTALRNWPDAAKAAERLQIVAPKSISSRIQAAYVDFWWKATTGTLKRVLAQMPVGTDPDGVITAGRWDVALIDRNFDAAQDVLNSSSLEAVSYLNGEPTPKSFLQGCVLLARGNSAAARENFEKARTFFENSVKEAPQNAERHANLGLVNAFLGRKDDAIREGRRAVELKPESKDAFDGAIMNCYLALIYARAGEKELALPLIERLSKTPGAVDSVDYSITANDLKFRWEWDPIRNDPRFKKIIADAAAAEQR